MLVSKYLYDSGTGSPQRFDVVVFRFPNEPIENGVPTNYIKRLLGLAGETIAIFMGQLFVLPPDTIDYPVPKTPDGKIANELNWWHPEHQHVDNDKAIALFRKDATLFASDKNQFQIIRKPPSVMLAMRRIVYDNDHQAEDLKGHLPPRWASEKGVASWTTFDKTGFANDGSNDTMQWLRYRHILRPSNWDTVTPNDKKPQLITDFLGYNSHVTTGFRDRPYFGSNWVGDLMLEFELEVESTDGTTVVELRQGVDRFQARFDLSDGTCQLVRLSDPNDAKEVVETPLDSKEKVLKGAGKYRIRFANFDHRLTLWVNGSLVFGHGVDYAPPYRYDATTEKWVNTGPTTDDLEPASIGSLGGAIKVGHIKLWRDTYYIRTHKHVDRQMGRKSRELKYDYDVDNVKGIRGSGLLNEQFWRTPAEWDEYNDIGVTTLYVQKGHLLCLGDNSPESADSRSWGLVPKRLMLGRALVVYWPFMRAGFIR